ncbi:MAG: hypothetical protein AABW71_03785 [Nanoarchaeota archaeon]
MKIGIDFDDVITNFTDSLMNYHNKKYGTNILREQIIEWNWGVYWGIEREEADKRVNEFHEIHNTDNIKPLAEAIYSLKKLMKNNKVFIITGRPIKFKSKTEEWLKHHIKEDLEIIFAGEWHENQGASKATICKKMNIPVLLEDAPPAAIDCANQGIKVILFDNPWNKKLEHKNIIRVNNWKEAVEEVNKLK